MDNIIKNPTFIAVVAGVIAYSYIVWRKNNKQKKSKNKKNKKSDNNEILIGGVVAAIAWLIAYGYINHSKDTGNQQIQPIQKTHPNQVNNINNPQNIQTLPTYKLVREQSESPKSFTLMRPTGGITMPLAQTQVPEIFINNF
jgi:hypothetical protein